ncbi:MAG: hypothetical protein ACI358_01220 [Candidatus Limimorpha sp.]
MRKVLTALFLLALLANESYCQCCGAGNPINTVNGESTVRRGRQRLSLDYKSLKMSPQFYLRPTQPIQLFVKCDIPFRQKTDGLQMVDSWAFQTGLSYNFIFNN